MYTLIIKDNNVLYPNNYFIYFLIFISWILLQLLIFYEIWDFVAQFILFFVAFLFFLLLIRNGVKLFQSRKRFDFKKRIFKFLFALTILFLTILDFIPQNLIERLDWTLLYNKRMEIVEDIKKDKINLENDKDFYLYNVPFEYPVVSNGGNKIVVRKDIEKKYTIEFFISKFSFFSPDSKYIYTESKNYSKIFEEKVKTDPTQNKKLEKNWYRISGE